MMNSEDVSTPSGPLAFIEGHPEVMLVSGIALVVIVGAIVIRNKNGGATPTASAAPSDLSGLATDANGNHVVYVPTSTNFTTINKPTNSNNPTTTTNNNPPPPPPPTHTPVPPPTHTPVPPTVYSGYVRGRYSNAQVKAWDQGHPGGVPVRATPGGNGAITHLQAFGSKVTIVGGSVSGTSNIGSGLGSGQWLPLQGGGYISAYDVTGVQPSGGSGAGAGPTYRAGPVTTSAKSGMIWDVIHLVIHGESLSSLANHATSQAKNSGAPPQTLVTAGMIRTYNKLPHSTYVAPGTSIILPRYHIS